MKIIGQTESKLLIEASRDEIANLCGYYYGGSSGCPEIKAGVNINISAMYNQLKGLSELGSTMRSQKESLLKAATLLEMQAPIITVP